MTLLETGPGGKSFHHLLSLLLFELLHENIWQSIDAHWLKSHQCPLIDVNDCAWVPRHWLTVVTSFHASVQYVKYAASMCPFISCSKMLHCRFLLSSYYHSVRHLIVIMSWYALSLSPPFFFFSFLAKDRNAEGAGEAGEADGPGLRGASGEREQSFQRNPPTNPSERQRHG